MGFAKMHDQIVRPAHGEGAECPQFPFRQYRTGQVFNDLAPRIEPEDLGDFRRGLEHMLGAQTENLVPVGLIADIKRQLLICSLLFRWNCRLCQPQYILISTARSLRSRCDATARDETSATSSRNDPQLGRASSQRMRRVLGRWRGRCRAKMVHHVLLVVPLWFSTIGYPQWRAKAG